MNAFMHYVHVHLVGNVLHLVREAIAKDDFFYEKNCGSFVSFNYKSAFNVAHSAFPTPEDFPQKSKQVPDLMGCVSSCNFLFPPVKPFVCFVRFYCLTRQPLPFFSKQTTRCCPHCFAVCCALAMADGCTKRMQGPPDLKRYWSCPC